MQYNLQKRIVAGCAVISFLWLGGCSYGTADYDSAMSMLDDADHIFELKKENITDYITATGHLVSDVSTTVESSLNCPVSCVYIKAGDMVQKGDLLFSYDTSDLSKQLSDAQETYNAQAEYLAYQHSLNGRNLNQAEESGAMQVLRSQQYCQQAQKAYEETYQEYCNVVEQIRMVEEQIAQDPEPVEQLNADLQRLQSRLSVLSEKVSSQEKAVQQAEELLQNAEESRDKSVQGFKDAIEAEKYDKSLQPLEATVNELLEQLENPNVYAPVSGIVTELYAKKDSHVAGETAAVIAELDAMIASVQIDQNDVLKITTASSAELLLDGQKESIRGTVSRISHIQNENNLYTVELNIENSEHDKQLFLEMEVTAHIFTEQKESVLVAPYRYIQSDAQDQYFVLRITNDASGSIQTEKIPVTLGIISNDRAEIISESLQAGDRIVDDARAL